MQKAKIVLGDWHRILLGDAPAMFLLEVFLRTVVIYVILLALLRVLGKRMAGQLTLAELAVMLTLGGIVSMAMQTPDKGILLGILILVCALVFQRGLTWLEFRSARLETVTQGTVSRLVKDGVLELSEMRKSRISREQLFAVLRTREVFNLGRVRRVYLEACGEFSVYTAAEQPGLSTLPPSEAALRDDQPHRFSETRVCARCGALPEPAASSATCASCGGDQWQSAVVSAETVNA